ncbi:MAG: aminotransferase class I/II-fold pyridoxal phosphate-dependent enzyme [Gammaproteobacteria bacterium]|jgi:alanine-synthesizing transaminase|nr:aminotransferase class I/II-fold pyridoxal phosphate-dependent enzyme [Gammaproteobacteria bacterium]MDH3821595.1 aminotransferase class I/II-fold pyridoxal phosphate-dependent enzyme [Gammaproteobacteria bacterium]
MDHPIHTSEVLKDVRYEIRGQLANRALELEKRGYEIISLNIGNPGLFGFRTPETMRLAMIENLGQAEPYCHQKGIFPAREAVVMQQQNRGITGVSADEVFIGNGVSELIDLSLRALLNPGDEVLVPSPDYPLWSAAVALNGGTPRHYECRRKNAFVPDIEDMSRLINERTRAIVVINPNNPSGAVYDRQTLQGIAELAERHQLVVLADEIYDQMVYDDAEFIPMATVIENSVCLTYSGLSKIYRACGYRVGWCVFSGELDKAQDYVHGMELLAALRLCSNVPGQWAVQTALGGFQSIEELVRPGGRLYQSRQAIIDRAAQSEFLSVQRPMGAMYAFIRLDPRFKGSLDDQAFALELLEKYHVLVAPGSSFNTPYTDHFRVTTLPDTETINTVFDRIDECLAQHA